MPNAAKHVLYSHPPPRPRRPARPTHRESFPSTTNAKLGLDYLLFLADMRFSLAAIIALVAAPVLAQRGEDGTGEQMVLDSIHNVTGLEGTWSTGSKRVLTGPVSVILY